MASVTTLLFTSTALAIDGYYILADLCQIPNLYSRGTSAVSQFASRACSGAHRQDRHHRGCSSAMDLHEAVSLTIMAGLIVASSCIGTAWGDLSVFHPGELAPSFRAATRPDMPQIFSLPKPLRSRVLVANIVPERQPSCSWRDSWPFATTAPESLNTHRYLWCAPRARDRHASAG